MNPTITTVINAYLEHIDRQIRRGAFSPDHADNVRRDLKRFAEETGPDLPVSECRQHHLTEWLARHEKQWRSINTQRNAVSSVMACFSFAAEEELIPVCPFKRPRAMRNVPAMPRRPASSEEYKQLMRHGSRPLKRALFFLWNTGCRTCEMREMTWDDVADDVVILRRHKTDATGRPRIIALSPVVSAFLRWLRLRSRSKYIFTNCDGTPWNRHSFARHLRRTAERIGLDKDVEERVTAYCLRHSYACAAIVSGATSKNVADQLGHADTKMVERIYGSHTRGDVAYLTRVAKDIQNRRKN